MSKNCMRARYHQSDCGSHWPPKRKCSHRPYRASTARRGRRARAVPDQPRRALRQPRHCHGAPLHARFRLDFPSVRCPSTRYLRIGAKLRSHHTNRTGLMTKLFRTHACDESASHELRNLVRRVCSQSVRSRST